MGKTHVQSFVEEVLEPIEFEDVPKLKGQVKARLTGAQIRDVDMLAKAAGLSRNGFAEQLFYAALEDALFAYYESKKSVDLGEVKV